MKIKEVANKYFVKDKIKELSFIKRDAAIYNFLINTYWSKLKEFSVLDLWCWVWDYCIEFSKFCKSVDWLDIDPTNVSICKQRTQNIPNIHIVEKIEKKYDIILLYNVLHMEGRESLLDQIKSFCHESSIVIIVAMNKKFSLFASPKNYLQKLIKWYLIWENNNIPYNVFMLSKDDFKDRIINNGYSVEIILPISTFFTDILQMFNHVGLNIIKYIFFRNKSPHAIKQHTATIFADSKLINKYYGIWATILDIISFEDHFLNDLSKENIIVIKKL